MSEKSVIPGHEIHLAPTVEQRAIKTEANCAFLRDRLCHLIRETAYFRTRKLFLNALSDFQDRVIREGKRPRLGIAADITLNEVMLSKFLSGEDGKISAADFRLVVCMLDAFGVLNPDNQGEIIELVHKHSLFHALLHFLKVSDTTLDNIKSVTPGIYQAWRPSGSFPGRYWKGVLMISVDPVSRALCTKEHYAAIGIDGRRDRYITFDGHLVRKDYQYTIVSRNNDLSSLQFAFLPEASKYEEQVHTLDGIVADMTTARLHISRISYDLLHAKSEMTDGLWQTALDGMNVVDRDEVPASIRQRFEGKTPDNIASF